MSTDAIVLLEYWAEGAPEHFPNLLRVGPDGEVRWRARPATRERGAADAWIALALDRRRRVSASSWSGYRCEIDVETGEIASATFTK